MKKLSFIALVLSAVLLLCGCGADSRGSGDTTVPDTTDEVTTEADVSKIDFKAARIEGKMFAFIKNGDELSLDLSDNKKNFQSSRPSVAKVDAEGNITPRASGVTLIGYERDGEYGAVVVCVIGEETTVDMTSYGSSQLFEVGSSFMHTAPVGATCYETSDESVFNIDCASRLSFEKSGYEYITVSNASRPFSYSFIVYDRECE